MFEVSKWIFQDQNLKFSEQICSSKPHFSEGFELPVFSEQKSSSPSLNLKLWYKPIAHTPLNLLNGTRYEAYRMQHIKWPENSIWCNDRQFPLLWISRTRHLIRHAKIVSSWLRRMLGSSAGRWLLIKKETLAKWEITFSYRAVTLNLFLPHESQYKSLIQFFANTRSVQVDWDRAL